MKNDNMSLDGVNITIWAAAVVLCAIFWYIIGWTIFWIAVGALLLIATCYDGYLATRKSRLSKK